MSHALVQYNGPLVNSDANNVPSAIVERGADGSINVGPANTTALNAAAAFLGGLAVTTTTTLAAGATIITANATSAAFTVTLPPAAGSANQIITVIKIDSGANAVTVKGNVSELINASNTTSLASQYNLVRLWCNGTQWYVL